MATLFISVFDGAAVTLVDRPVQQMTITVAASSAQSAAITGQASKVRNVRLYTDTDCFVEWGADPTALNDGTGGIPLGADNPEVIGMRAGDLIATIERV